MEAIHSRCGLFQNASTLDELLEELKFSKILHLAPIRNSTLSFASITAITLVLLLSLSDVQGGSPGVAGGESGNPATDQAWRKELEDLGFTPTLEWDADVFVNARGGIKQDAVAGGLIRLALDINGYQLTGSAILHDTELHIEGIYPYGTDISTDVGELAILTF